MVDNSQIQVRSQVSKVLAHAYKQLPEDQATRVARFIRFFYAHMSVEDIQDRNITDLYGAALSQWELMHHRHPGELKLLVFNPHYEQHGWQSTHTIIQVVTDDIPFLVDSMRMELNRLSMTIHLMIYTGGISVFRDEEGYVTKILPYETRKEKSVIESPIYMEIDRQTDPKILADIQQNLWRVIDDVQLVVHDWKPMQKCMQEMIQELSQGHLPQKKSELEESIAFLEWLLADHFTFLGVRDYEVVGKEGNLALRLIPKSGLGVLRDETRSKVYRQISELPKQAQELMLSKEQILVISKTNTRSTVHRPAYTDYIGVKRFNDKGEFIGERRFIGLYTSTAYSSNPLEIPILRKKELSVLKKTELPIRSHGGKDLMHILATLPRDDLFQATEDELYDLALGILHLQDRRKVRLFIRKDAYGRFVSCLVYLPRENFNTDLINRMQEILMEDFGGLEASFTTYFTESILARIHYIIRVDPSQKLQYNLKEIEKKLIEISKSWEDGFRENVLDYFGEERGNYIFNKYKNAFPVSYREAFVPRNAIYDIEHIEKLTQKKQLGMSFYRPFGAARNVIKFKLFRLNQTVPLSDALPMLENMGLRVIGEVPHQIIFEDGQEIWINDFSMTYPKEPSFDVEAVKNIFQKAFYRVWNYDAENDSFNRLVLEAQLNWREISILRAYTKYLRQTGFMFSPQYIAETLVNNSDIAKLLVKLFKCLFDPKFTDDRKAKEAQLESLIHKKLDDVLMLDDDRILRRYCEIIHATLRTNYFQTDRSGKPKKYLAFKIDPHKVPELPLPLPKYEIFVYSPEFEGIHLRADKVARGGIRWSDRREDFRTEILGLMKAQQVKNALIVPAGAKGGFVPKNIPIDASREESLEKGICCYRGFIHGLLDLTDNLKGEKIIKPINTVCYDESDPYLVVAADKGTATFSDIANSIAMEHNFWLADAFASGGSTGYDHKKMGITARGAWISAERHFQELGININNSEITVVGIGDMSGDVFGNGMLLSSHIKLIAAFDFQHIFLDPDPSSEISYQERMRLYNMPRSTWDDYNRKLISKGGGVYPRTAKAIKITPEVKKLLRMHKDVLIPSDLIKSILKAPVDLIWNGGVGIFIKASTESNADVGDRSNDAIRVNGNELQARVVCEGGNLGLTQLARVEYELNGGKVNTDFIDNSAGVDCSDHEVNIKILLSSIVREGDLTEKQRNQLLAKMTDEVASLVLENNYFQNRAISLAAYLSPSQVGLYIRYIGAMEEAEKLNRELEFLPDDKTLLERKAQGLGLTRPELSVLFAYTKILIDEFIRKSDLPDDPYLSQYVQYAFPIILRKRYRTQLMKHRLSREIISTQVCNRLVSDMGITFAYQMYDETGADITAIVKAYTIAREIFHMAELTTKIQSLDYTVDAMLQLRMYEDVIRLIRRATRWFLRTRRNRLDIAETITYFSDHVVSLSRRLPSLLVGSIKEKVDKHYNELVAADVPHNIALKIAGISPMYHILNIVEGAAFYEANTYHVARIYFTLVERLDLTWIREQINTYPSDSRWAVLAKAGYKGDLDWIQRKLTIGVLKLKVNKSGINARIQAWLDKHHNLVERWKKVLADLRSSESKDFSILAVAVRELSDLAQINTQEKL